MSEQTGKLKNKIKAVFAELRQFQEYVDGYLKEISWQLFTLKETQAALVEHLKCEKELIAIIEARREETEKERARLKAELEEKRIKMEAEAGKLHDALGSDGQVNAN